MPRLRHLAAAGVGTWYFGGFLLLWVGLEDLVLQEGSGDGLVLVAAAMAVWLGLSTLLRRVARPPSPPIGKTNQ